MRKNTVHILILLFISFTTVQANSNFNMTEESVTVSNTLRVMCYNIHHCDPPYNTGEATEIDTIIGVIVKQKPDIVALQEVDVYTTRSGSNVHQAKVIAERLGMYYFFAPAIDYQGGKYGIAILSKYPLSENSLIQLPRPDTSGEKRVLATSKITLPDGTAIRFGCTHLDTKTENRQAQIDKVNELALLETLPYIIAGDFNANEGSVVINRLDQVFTRTCTNCPKTSPARNPQNAIDYIAYRDTQSKFSVTSHKAVNETYASDHRPIVADFTYITETLAITTQRSTLFKVAGRLITTEQPTELRVFNLLGVALLHQKNISSYEIPESIGKGIFIVVTTLGSQKITIK
jgi:endonuclease/exonuclease/phosphatase family metal-dependent hydrolase